MNRPVPSSARGTHRVDGDVGFVDKVISASVTPPETVIDQKSNHHDVINLELNEASNLPKLLFIIQSITTPPPKDSTDSVREHAHIL